MSSKRAALLLEVSGAMSVTAGVALVSVAAALIVGGLLAIAFAVALELPGRS